MVKFRNQLTQQFKILQGVRQGGVTSTCDYKLYCNDLLDMAEDMDIGFKVDGLFLGTPTCADDIVLLGGSPFEIQCLLNLAKHYADKERYVLHPQKSMLSCYNVEQVWKDFLKEEGCITIGDTPITISDEFTHLGINRHNSSLANTLLLGERIKLGRRTCYALMGAGMYAAKGTPVIISTKLYTTFVTPRMISGLESIVLSTKDLYHLELYHKSTLRILQGLPKFTASEGVYLLSGVKPIESYIHLRVLSLFGAICRMKGSRIWNLAISQLASKSSNSNSWFIHVSKLLEKYHLPDPVPLLCNPKEKLQWKNEAKRAVFGYWNNKLVSDAKEKSSLKHVHWNIPVNPSKNSTHRIWSCCSNNIILSSKAYTKVKIMLHVYGLGKRLFRINKPSGCPICQSPEEENETHFIANCRDKDFTKERMYYVNKLNNLDFLCDVLFDGWENDEQFFTQMVLDFTPLVSNSTQKVKIEEQHYLESLNIHYIHRLHTKRTEKLTKPPTSA